MQQNRGKAELAVAASGRPPVPSQATDDLSGLVAAVRREHRAIIRLGEKALDHAIKAGEALVQIKAKLRRQRGQSWTRWTRANLDISKQQADTYIRVYNGRDKIGRLLPKNRSISGAADVLAGRADEFGEPLHGSRRGRPASRSRADGDREIRIDPDVLLAAVRDCEIDISIARRDVVDALNIIMGEVGAGVYFSSAEDDED